MYNPIPIKRNDNFRSNYWDAYSPTLKRDVCFLGQLNYEYWLFLELCPEVVSFCERPISIKGIVNNRIKKIILNFWVKYEDGTEVFVVITEKEKEIHQLIYNWCQSNNHNYKFISKDDIRKNKLLIINAQKMLPYLHRSKTLDIDVHLVKKQIVSGRKSIRMIIHELEKNLTPQRTKEAIYWLVFEKKVDSDVYQKPLSLNTEVWKCQKER